jgi:hypothetical protein
MNLFFEHQPSPKLPAAFTRLARRANRPAVLRLVSVCHQIVQAVLTALPWRATQKAAEAASGDSHCRRTSRKTAGLLALRANRLKAAINLSNPEVEAFLVVERKIIPSARVLRRPLTGPASS